MTDPNERVMYVAPKSMGFGHAARARSARKGRAKTLEFMKRSMHYELRERLVFECPQSGDGLDASVREEYLSYARSILGPEGGVPGYPSWSARKDQLETCIDLALNEDRWPRQRYGPAHFNFCYDFVWLQEGTQRIERDHAANEVPKYSWIGVSIGSGRVFLQPFFFFPFSSECKELQSMLKIIGEWMPFKFSPHHFKRAFPSKNGHSYSSRRLPSDWLQSNNALQPTCEDARG